MYRLQWLAIISSLLEPLKFLRAGKNKLPFCLLCGNNNVNGPFENGLSKFHGKTVIPLCLVVFGEVNEDLDKVTQCLAGQEAASPASEAEEGLTISPLVNTSTRIGKEEPTVLCYHNSNKQLIRNKNMQHL